MKRGRVKTWPLFLLFKVRGVLKNGNIEINADWVGVQNIAPYEVTKYEHTIRDENFSPLNPAFLGRVV